MKRLLIIFTGGTIGSKAEGKSINVHDAGSYALLEAYRRMDGARQDVEWQTLEPLNLLSENMTTDDWRALAVAIRQADPSRYDGVIVTHGSDTLAYTASMLSFLFADATVPIVLTASNYPITDERANGLRNLAGAVDFVVEAELPGVFVVYENDRSETLVYLGTRISQCESFTDQFGSPYELPYGVMDGRRFVWRDDASNPRPESLGRARVLGDRAAEDLSSASSVGDEQLSDSTIQPEHAQRAASIGQTSSAPPREADELTQGHSVLQWEPESLRLDDSVLYIRPYPGLNYSLYEWGKRKPSAILHDLHHSGTACALPGGPYSLPAFIARCKAQGIDVYLSPLKDASDAMYASSHALIEAGGVFLEGMGMEAALTKLIAVYGIATDVGQARAWMTEETFYYEKMSPAGHV